MYYLQSPQGECLYPVISSDYSSAFEGEVGGVISHGSGRYVHKVLTAGPVTEVWRVIKTHAPTGMWTLRDPDLESKALPLTITHEAGNQLDESLQEMYSPGWTATETRESVDVSGYRPLVDSDWPTERSPRNWRPSAWVDIYGDIASHLVPGSLTGFRAHMKEIGGRYGDCYDHSSNTKMTFNVRAYYDPPRHTTEKQGRKRIQRETCMTSRLELDVPDVITGKNLTDAQANWAKAEADLVNILDAHGKTRTCGHCEGRGFTIATKQGDI